ncbi:MAG: PAS domain S-box protein [Verrucomicrobia bacterium]|nr:PAS domain S-box protein [Verrucomicrobiota bacterium]
MSSPGPALEGRGDGSADAAAFRQAVELAREGFALTDRLGCFTYLNREHVRLFGYDTADELLGQSWRVLYADDGVRRVEGEALPALAERGYWHGHVMARRRDGTQFHEDLTLSAMPDGRIVCNCRDRTTEVTLAEDIRAREGLLRQFIDSLESGVTIRQCDGRYEYANEPMARMLDLPVREIIGRQELERGPTELLRIMRELDAQVAASGRRFETERSYQWEGREQTVYVAKTPVSQESGVVSHVCTLVRDVTRKRKLEREAREVGERRQHYAEMQREFISMVSHEFRTPLTAIQGTHYLVEQHLKQFPTDAVAPMVRLLGIQAESLATMRDLVDQVLRLNRIEHQSAEVQLRPLRVGHLLERVVTSFNAAMVAPRVEWSNELPAEFLAPSDATRLRTAVENLISNGLKYSPADKPVRVRAGLTAEGWRIVVADEGRGIPEAEQAKVFQPFFRSSNVARVSGTGLGLTIVKRLAESLGGGVAFISRENAGSSFVLEFSSAQPPGPATP